MSMVFKERVREHIACGELVAVLEAFTAGFPGFYLYYPERGHASAALRALIDHLRQARRTMGVGS